MRARCELVIEAIERLATVSASTAKMVLDQNLGQVPLFLAYASHALQIKYLPKMRDGSAQMAFLMTEPQSGSVLQKFSCTAKGVEGGFLLNGRKDWITGASARSLFLVVAKSFESAPNHFGIFLVDRSRDDVGASIRISPAKQQLGLRGMGEHLVEFDGTFVPQEHVIIPFGQSTISQVMEYYNLKRCGQAAIAIGLSFSALTFAYSYLKKRHPGVKGGLAFQHAEFTCAHMHSLVQAAKQLNKWAVDKVLGGDKTGVPSSMAKLIATEGAVGITNSAIQLCGADGTSSHLPLERFMRDARMLTIVGGTSEIQRRTIARHLSKLESSYPPCSNRSSVHLSWCPSPLTSRGCPTRASVAWVG